MARQARRRDIEERSPRRSVSRDSEDGWEDFLRHPGELNHSFKGRGTAPVSEHDFEFEDEGIREQSDFTEELSDSGFRQQAGRELRRCVAEADELMKKNRWQDLIELFYPPEEKVLQGGDRELQLALRLKVAFALGQIGRFGDALDCLQPALKHHPEDFLLHSSIAYNAYQSLYADQNRTVLLTPEQRKERIELAHRHFRHCGEIRPEAVTGFYREAMLFKQIERKFLRAIPLFERAISNWERRSGAEQEKRHQERPKYIRSLYHLAPCYLFAGEGGKALDVIQRCMEKDRERNIMHPLYKHFVMGKILYALRRPAEALDHLETAVHAARKRLPTDFVWELAARCGLMLGDPKRSARYIGQIPQKRRKPYIVWTEAQVWAALGNEQKAESLLTASAEKDRRSRHKALLQLARMHYRRGEIRKALKEAEQANAFCADCYGNDCHEALFLMAGYLFRLGRAEEALRKVRDLKRLNPDYPHLNRLEEEIRKHLRRQ